MQTDHSDGAVPEVDAAAGRSLVAAGGTLLDVRELVEWEAGHAPEAIHVPLGQLPTVTTAIGAAGDVGTVVVICRSGNRSRTAAEALRSVGYDAVNLAGGMFAWITAGGAAVDGSGAPGVVV